MFKLTSRGLPEVQKILNDAPRGCKGAALEAWTEAVIGNERQGLKHYPPKRGQKYERTFTAQRGWTSRGDSTQRRIVNDVPYVRYIPRWKKYGWREWMAVVQSNMKLGMMRANQAVQRWIKEHSR